MYFCEIDRQGIRLSIEGSQIVGPKAVQNVVEISEEEAKRWLKGEDLEKECKDCNGFVILKHNKDFLGNGKYKNGRILNYVGKARRISASH
jgi:NOL1/NOP2/fmu family ribosome biogenesis protein